MIKNAGNDQKMTNQHLKLRMKIVKWEKKCKYIYLILNKHTEQSLLMFD